MEKRPAGVTILSFIYLLVACIGLWALFSVSERAWGGIAVYSLILIAAVSFFMGKSWSWWVFGVFATFSIMVNVMQLALLLMNAELVQDWSKALLKPGGKVLFQSLIVVFLFSQPVLDFCQFNDQSKLKKLGILVAVALGLFLFLSLR